jgi:hypothetical protein
MPRNTDRHGETGPSKPREGQLLTVSDVTNATKIAHAGRECMDIGRVRGLTPNLANDFYWLCPILSETDNAIKISDLRSDASSSEVPIPTLSRAGATESTRCLLSEGNGHTSG